MVRYYTTRKWHEKRIPTQPNLAWLTLSEVAKALKEIAIQKRNLPLGLHC